MQKILFVINPVAGGKRTDLQYLADQIKNNLPSEYQYDIKVWATYSQYTEISTMIQYGDYTMAVAAGGDGTINFVARQAMQKDITLGIIPMGSGNGFARHLGIPLDIPGAVKNLASGKVHTIDTGVINGNIFFCTTGAGFDAMIGDMFSRSTTRGLFTYAKMSLQQLMKYKPREYRIVFDGKEVTRKAFILCIANVNQYGNNTFIAPQADVADGMLDVCILKPFNLLQGVPLAWRIFNKSLTGSGRYEFYRAKKVEVYLSQDDPVHYDGEPVNLGRKLDIEVRPGTLKVAAP